MASPLDLDEEPRTPPPRTDRGGAPVKLSVTWSTKRIGNEGWVLEEHSDGTREEFGPMPAHIVPAFVNGRRQIINTMMVDGAGARKLSDDSIH